MHLDFPPIYLLPTRIGPDELPELESRIPSLTYDINEAEIVLGRISTRTRAIYELKWKKILTEEIPSPDSSDTQAAPPPAKRQKVCHPKPAVNGGGSSTASDTEDEPEKSLGTVAISSNALTKSPQRPEIGEADSVVKVVRFAWLTDSLAKGTVLPVDGYLLYQGRKKPTVTSRTSSESGDSPRRTKEDSVNEPPTSQNSISHEYASSQHPRTSDPKKRPALLLETTSEHDRAERLPPLPDYLRTKYSCQRPTPSSPPNEAFIEELGKMRIVRTLQDDETGVRAYSTSIAAIAAYPYLISHVSEVARLPGCAERTVENYLQWESEGSIEETRKLTTDSRLSVLNQFYEIWGVAATTARQFYNRGWRDLDDIVEHGWDKINRVQQIGVKYYDEIREKIPRAEVELIGDVILRHANERRKGYQMCIVGGYRRGKSASGDVDVVLSHPDLAATEHFVTDIVNSLEGDRYITHTLIMSDKNSERGQQPVPWKGNVRTAHSGFDTLDKALVVWQNPDWDRSVSSKNPNPHRRVDIIISPWRTVGCAIVGWSGATTFERDLRRYCKAQRGLKFDSSGVRNRTNGEWVDLESDQTGRPAPDMLTAEKRVFEGLGLVWRRPEERCTG